MNNSLKLCEFALTNVCTAKCHFCTIWKQKPKHIVNIDQAIKTITHLAHLGVRFITLTGGEPLLHPHFDKIISECTKRNITSSILNADARLFTQKRLDALKRSKVDLVCISIDHHTDKIASFSRTIPNILSHIQKAVTELKKRNITTMASTLICNYNHRTLDELFNKCTEIGFDIISVNYPEFSESPVYTLGGDAINLKKDEIINALRNVIKLKKKYNIINFNHSIYNIIDYLKNNKPKYMCLGGYRMLFIDWSFNAYPCMYLPYHLGNILELKKQELKKKMCNECNMSWYRDFSVYFQGIKSIKPVLSSIPFILSTKFSR